MTGAERRKANRVTVHWAARIGRKGLGVAPAQVRNISIGGAFVESALQLPAQTQILMEVAAEHGGDKRKLLIEAMILRVVPPAASNLWGYGVRFQHLRDDDLFYLLAVVAELWAAGAAAD